MFAYSIIEAYMKAKNYTQAKQAAADLGFDDSMISNIKRGAKKLPEESAIYMAERCGLDVDEVMIKLRAEQAKSESEKAVWERILKKYKHGINPTMSLIISGLLLNLSPLFNFAYCNNVLNAQFLMKRLKIVPFEVLNGESKISA